MQSLRKRFVDLYRLFNIPPSASEAEIKKSFFAAAKECHPDGKLFGDFKELRRVPSAFLSSTFHLYAFAACSAPGGGDPAKFRRLSEAYSVLRSERRAYDELYRQHVSPGFSGFHNDFSFGPFSSGTSRWPFGWQ